MEVNVNAPKKHAAPVLRIEAIRVTRGQVPPKRRCPFSGVDKDSKDLAAGDLRASGNPPPPPPRYEVTLNITVLLTIKIT